MSKLITYQTAKLAKEKGFDLGIYTLQYNDEEGWEKLTSTPHYYPQGCSCCKVSSQFQLQDWFAEKHGVAVLVDLDCTLSWIWKIIPLHPKASIQEQFVSSGVYSTKQLALEEGLFKALTELK